MINVKKFKIFLPNTILWSKKQKKRLYPVDHVIVGHQMVIWKTSQNLMKKLNKLGNLLLKFDFIINNLNSGT